MLLRPYGDQSDESMPAEDLWTYEKIGQKGTEITGYPAISVYHDFRYHPRKVITGTFNDWMYDHMGAFAWVVEIWSPQRQAGIEDDKFIDWYREHPLEDDLKMLKWSDEVLEGKGYVDWYPYEHPQLGPVELGGWDYLYAFRNPPPALLEKEIAPFADWLVWHLLISPRLELYEASAKPLGEDTYHVRLVVQNTGWLPTYVTKKAVEKKLARGICARSSSPKGHRSKPASRGRNSDNWKAAPTSPPARVVSIRTTHQRTHQGGVGGTRPPGRHGQAHGSSERAGTLIAEVELTWTSAAKVTHAGHNGNSQNHAAPPVYLSPLYHCIGQGAVWCPPVDG